LASLAQACALVAQKKAKIAAQKEVQRTRPSFDHEHHLPVKGIPRSETAAMRLAYYEEYSEKFEGKVDGQEVLMFFFLMLGCLGIIFAEMHEVARRAAGSSRWRPYLDGPRPAAPRRIRRYSPRGSQSFLRWLLVNLTSREDEGVQLLDVPRS
jgi:hypothetical protein